MDMALVAPKTAAVMALDDDSAVPSALELREAYDRWERHGGLPNAGLDASRGAPVVIPAATVGRTEYCRPVFAYLGHPHCVKGRSWVVENPFIYHEHWARHFTLSPDLAPLRAFVREQPSHPDDLAFGTFVNWASGGGALCKDDTSKHLNHSGWAVAENREVAAAAEAVEAGSAGRRLLIERAGAQGARTKEDDYEAWHRRRLRGLSGGPEWLFLRSHGAMWVLHFFGGFYAPRGCWVQTRVDDESQRHDFFIPPENHHDRCHLPAMANHLHAPNGHHHAPHHEDRSNSYLT